MFLHNGYNPTYKGSPFAGDVMFTGGYSQEFFGDPEESHSVDNCVSGNVITDATFPTDIEGEWGCRHSTTPIPGYGGVGRGLSGILPESVEYLLALKTESEARHPEGQPAPPPQPTMPNPCKGVPKNPLCPRLGDA